jgi:hypothetical protein
LRKSGQRANRFAHLTSAVDRPAVTLDLIWLGGFPRYARGHKGSSHEAVWGIVPAFALIFLTAGCNDYGNTFSEQYRRESVFDLSFQRQRWRS